MIVSLYYTFSLKWSLQFEKWFCAWVAAVCKKTEGEVVSIDEKTLRRSGSANQKPIHMVSAWANEQQMVLGELATEEKSNEITAVPQLLDMLDVSGCIVTTDAMSCQKGIVKKVVEKQADYVLSLKENQPAFCHEVQAYFSDAVKSPKEYPEIQQRKPLDSGHGRFESRTYYLSTEIDWYQDLAQWANLHAIGMVCSKTERNGQFYEDFGRIRKNHSAENMAVVRHIALNILKNYPVNISLARKRRRCSYDGAFLADVLLSIHA